MKELKKNGLKEITKYWYEKLKEEGFEDIENNENLKKFSSYYYYSNDPVKIICNQKYYENASSFLYSDYFKSSNKRNYQFITCDWFKKKNRNNVDKKIWEMHSNGISFRKISKKIDVNLRYVFIIINEIKNIMMNGNYN